MKNKLDKILADLKKFQTPIEDYVFELLLLVWPVAMIRQGLDIKDSTYNLGNYLFIDMMDKRWGLSIFLPSRLGHLLSLLPGGATVLGMKIYTCFIISIIALIVYFGLRNIMPGWMIFAGAWLAECLCWCPCVILYNYLTYLAMTLGLILLIHAIMSLEGRGRNIRLLAAGLVFGLGVAVRLPNLTHSAFILILWFAALLQGREFRSLIRETFLCIGGYLLGILLPLIYGLLIYGPSAYVDMFSWLSEISREPGSSHGIASSLMSTLEAYLTTATHMLILIPCIIAGILMIMLFRGGRDHRAVLYAKVAYGAGIVVLIRYYFSRGVFTFNYHYYDSFFQAAMMIIIFSIFLDIIDLISAAADIMGRGRVLLPGTDIERIMALTSLLVIIITPLGSDNYTFPLINNLFIVMPVTLTQIRRLLRRVSADSSREPLHYPWKAVLLSLLLVLYVQAGLFKLGFAFGDGDDGAVRNATSSIIPAAKGMVSSRARIDELDSLYSFLESEDLLDHKLLQFGDAPGLSFLFGMEPAIETTWPTLSSNSVEFFDRQLLEAEGDIVIITRRDLGEVVPGEDALGRKIGSMLDYIDDKGYNIVFGTDNLDVYVRSGN
ncbi:hypothetical protein [Butyrivibrio sp. MC2013]|uniref:hypothetical protein n=1 Tax=Butyrivibrio sp. MC2013 TaxID=1280686 RepID=UPI000407E2FF|nr:hypothetical protein [Butyrivibrio sp. MC2013]